MTITDAESRWRYIKDLHEIGSVLDIEAGKARVFGLWGFQERCTALAEEARSHAAGITEQLRQEAHDARYDRAD